jgi:hypothetical protein
MLDNAIIKKIEDFVYLKPRSIQEIASHIGKNWRTADRYVQEIGKDFGTLGMRIFREGTRGALKIVYWASVEKVSHSVFQEQLEKMIMRAAGKEDFAAFDIFQHVPERGKKAWMQFGEKEAALGKLWKFRDLLLSAKRQVLFFSGNLSFINYKNGDVDIFEALDELVKRGISIKVVCRVDLAGIDNIKRLLSLNFKYGKELVEIRHREQPLRVTIIDKDAINMKEIKKPTGREKELNKKVFIFYDIKDKDWIDWISRIFWKMFSSSVDANKRLKEMEHLRNDKAKK